MGSTPTSASKERIIMCHECDDEYDEYPDPPASYSRNYNAPHGVHIMNKDEGRVMRRLKNETGLTEVEIRKVKKYRVMLSEAQKKGQNGKRGRVQKARDEVMRFVCRQLKLAKEHPVTQKAYREEWERRRKEYANRPCCNSSIYQQYSHGLGPNE